MSTKAIHCSMCCLLFPKEEYIKFKAETVYTKISNIEDYSSTRPLFNTKWIASTEMSWAVLNNSLHLPAAHEGNKELSTAIVNVNRPKWATMKDITYQRKQNNCKVICYTMKSIRYIHGYIPLAFYISFRILSYQLEEWMVDRQKWVTMKTQII